MHDVQPNAGQRMRVWTEAAMHEAEDCQNLPSKLLCVFLADQ